MIVHLDADPHIRQENKLVVFKRMLGAFGVGAPSVDTVLATPSIQPGGSLSGEVRLAGGDFDAEIEHVTLHLVARIEVEHGEAESGALSEFGSVRVSGPFTLAKGEQKVIGFELPTSWETPVTRIGGRPLTGMAVGVRTELAIAKAVDKGDLDVFAVEPLPSQRAILEALLDLGFRVKSADLEAGSLYGVRQELPFYQEIEFHPPAQAPVGEIEITFVATPHTLDVVIEADKAGGHYTDDAIGRFALTHEEALRTDWPLRLREWLTGLSSYGTPHYRPHGLSGHHEGGGFGGVAVGVAAGVAGGLIVGEVVEEVVEEAAEEVFDGGDEGGDW
ncbi:sporulation protein [Nonomuraea sp. NPDC050328]|uniref:sporulation protein n=1 Tax=Nonomuraea sp. NPDC050328 TaxID=3364361 RepID=UPI00379FC06E